MILTFSKVCDNFTYMTTMLTVTDKGQITLSKTLLEALGVEKGGKIALKVRENKVIIEPVGGGILDLTSILGELKIPKGKTADDLIEESKEEALGKDLR